MNYLNEDKYEPVVKSQFIIGDVVYSEGALGFLLYTREDLMCHVHFKKGVRTVKLSSLTGARKKLVKQLWIKLDLWGEYIVTETEEPGAVLFVQHDTAGYVEQVVEDTKAGEVTQVV